MSKKVRYSLRRVRLDYTYTPDEIAQIYNIKPSTVFRWIREEGLKCLPYSKKYFVHSTDFIAFLKLKNAKHKKPCKEGEVYCCKCRGPQIPKKESLSHQRQPNKSIRIIAKCNACDTSMHKLVSHKNWTKKHPFYPKLLTPTTQHNGVRWSLLKGKYNKGDQLCLNITL